MFWSELCQSLVASGFFFPFRSRYNRFVHHVVSFHSKKDHDDGNRHTAACSYGPVVLYRWPTDPLGYPECRQDLVGLRQGNPCCGGIRGECVGVFSLHVDVHTCAYICTCVCLCVRIFGLDICRHLCRHATDSFSLSRTIHQTRTDTVTHSPFSPIHTHTHTCT